MLRSLTLLAVRYDRVMYLILEENEWQDRKEAGEESSFYMHMRV
jgi:hypothetical protein